MATKKEPKKFTPKELRSLKSPSDYIAMKAVKAERRARRKANQQ